MIIQYIYIYTNSSVDVAASTSPSSLLALGIPHEQFIWISECVCRFKHRRQKRSKQKTLNKCVGSIWDSIFLFSAVYETHCFERIETSKKKLCYQDAKQVCSRLNTSQEFFKRRVAFHMNSAWSSIYLRCLGCGEWTNAQACLGEILKLVMCVLSANNSMWIYVNI